MSIPTKTAASNLMTAARVTVLFGCALFALRTVWWEVAAVTEVYGPWWPALLQATLLLGFVALTGRWATALVLWVGSVSLVRLISRIKFEYLHSPLDASDLRQLDLQSLQQTLVHYPWIVAAVSAAATAAIAAWLIVAGMGRPLGWRARLLSLALAALLAAGQYRALSQLPQEGDLMESRSLMALALSFFLQPADLDVPTDARSASVDVSCPAEPTDVMVVLQESTFRTRQAARSDDVSLRRFFGGDAYAGQLKVHVYGGKTHLTDFAFLIGLPHLALAGEREYLSRTLVGRIDHSLPLALRRCGYESTVIYPVARNYFNALNWFVAVGFDHVISPEDVGLAGADAWHMPDERFFEQALKVAQAARKPQLIYVLTIAQHGPHDQVGGAEGAQDEYHRRLLASARAFNGLADALGASGAARPWLLAWFGDHRPHRIGDGDGGNPYTTWATVRRVGHGAAAPLPELPTGIDIAFFGHLLMRSIGVRTEPLGALVDAMLEDCAADYFQCSEALRHEHQQVLRSVGAIRPVSGAASSSP